MINDIKTEGKYIIKCLISHCDVNKTNKGTPYLSLILEDSSGQLDAKFWNLTEEQVSKYHVGMVVEAKGDVILYRNALQFRVQKMHEIEDAHMADYVQNAPMSKDEMQKEINTYVDMITNDVLNSIVTLILEENEEDFYSYPAATRNHHAFVGGLAYHTLSMARMAVSIADQYTYLDKSLLLAGVLMHDIGKIIELSQPVLAEYTPEGNLLGHISIMNCKIDETAVQLDVGDCEEVVLLKHMVLSHHGKHEFGSPVLPMIPEAEVLSTIDDLDAKLFMMKESIDATKPGEFGPRIFALEGRMIYHRKGEKE